MISDGLRLKLVEALLCVPGVASDSGFENRTALLAGIPAVQYLRRNESNAGRDMMLIVAQLEEAFGAIDEWRLLQVVNNAAHSVRGTELGTRLVRLRDELDKELRGVRSVQLRPADVAQVHLFDLRKPVLICLGSLPEVAAASGFVVTTPTPRLLRYFCDSLKQHGEREGIWERGQVAPPGPPLVVDPVHTTVAVAASRSDRARRLLVTKHVLWPIYVDNAADAAELWKQLAAAFGSALSHHLVVAFGMPPGVDAPQGMIRLPAPKFTRQDISNWVIPIGETVPLDSNDIELWASVIAVGCSGTSDDLPIEMVYEQLELHRGLITQHRNPTDLMSAVRDLATWNL